MSYEDNTVAELLEILDEVHEQRKSNEISHAAYTMIVLEIGQVILDRGGAELEKIIGDANKAFDHAMGILGWSNKKTT